MNERYPMGVTAPLRTWSTTEIDLGYRERLSRPFQGEFGDSDGDTCRCGEHYTVNYPPCTNCGRCRRCCRCKAR